MYPENGAQYAYRRYEGTCMYITLFFLSVAFFFFSLCSFPHPQSLNFPS